MGTQLEVPRAAPGHLLHSRVQRPFGMGGFQLGTAALAGDGGSGVGTWGHPSLPASIWASLNVTEHRRGAGSEGEGE